MSEPIDFANDLDLDDNRIIKGGFESLVADPGSPVTGQQWNNSTDARQRVQLGGSTKTLAFLEDVQNLGSHIGGHDASTGIPTSVPTSVRPSGTIEAGDTWYITVAGTITGIGGGEAELHPGDMLKAIADGASSASDFISIQRNLDDDKASYTDSQVLNLPANTDTTITAAFAGRITSVQTYKQNGKEVKISTKRGTNPNQIILHPNKTLSNVTVDLVGFIS